MYVVEVRRKGDDVADTMGRMRSWLDDRQIAPSLFRLGRLSFCLEFVTEADAHAFADAFDGRRMVVEGAQQVHRAAAAKSASRGGRSAKSGAPQKSHRKISGTGLDTRIPSPASHARASR
jgi:hypothetical protein